MPAARQLPPSGQHVVDGNGEIRKGIRAQDFPRADRRHLGVAVVGRSGVPPEGPGRKIDDPIFRNLGARVEGRLDTQVLAQRRLCDLDDEQRMPRMLPLVIGDRHHGQIRFRLRFV